jgi:hypothetical protein
MVVDGDLGAFSGRAESDGAADAAGGSGDEDDLVFQGLRHDERRARHAVPPTFPGSTKEV